jgi:uncharacterized membrane protein
MMTASAAMAVSVMARYDLPVIAAAVGMLASYQGGVLLCWHIFL